MSLPVLKKLHCHYDEQRKVLTDWLLQKYGNVNEFESIKIDNSHNIKMMCALKDSLDTDSEKHPETAYTEKKINLLIFCN